MEYLAIKNWDKYQPSRGASAWVKDWTDKDSDMAYMKLTCFQRYILDGCRRLRGKFGRDLPNDPEYIARALQVIPKERHCVPRSICVLVERGFLVVTNQQVDFLDKDKEEEKEEEKPITSHSRSTESEVMPTEPAGNGAKNHVHRDAVTKASRKTPRLAESQFEKAYQQYPRHVGKGAAEKAWAKAVVRQREVTGDAPDVEDFLYQRVMQYAALCRSSGKEKQFIPHMATWLNQDRFFDDPTEWAVNGNGRTEGNHVAGQVAAKSLAEADCPTCHGSGFDLSSGKADRCACWKKNRAATSANGAANGRSIERAGAYAASPSPDFKAAGTNDR